MVEILPSQLGLDIFMYQSLVEFLVSSIVLSLVRISYSQLIVFGYDCMSLGDIVHEIMHVLGFPHEHMRPDRDQYITILWDNIKPGEETFTSFYYSYAQSARFQ